MFSRTEMLVGEEAVAKLKNARVAVFGVGGVGGYVVEALVRAGVGHVALVDNDVVSKSNLNRQIIALHSTIGRKKTEVMAERVKDINPACQVETYDIFFLPETPFDFSAYDYVVDAIDTVSGKLSIIERCTKANIPVISSMGTGNKRLTAPFEVADISQTSVCPLARVMRRELKKRGIERLKVVYSKEEPSAVKTAENTGEKTPPASISFVPPMAGLLLASEVIKHLIG